MQYLTAYPEAVLAIDAGQGHEHCATVYMIVNNGRVALIDAGTDASVRPVLESLSTAGLSPRVVDYVILTHLHLDHAAGAGHLMAALPNTRLLVHPAGVRHVVAPERLWQANVDVYGEAQVRQRYGEVLPVAPDRVEEATDGMTLTLAGRALRIVHTPGHSTQHLAVWDARSRTFFAGDAFGVSPPGLAVDEHSFVFPSTMPSGFDPVAMHTSIDRMLQARPEAMYLGHGARVTDVIRLAADLHRLIDAQIAVARAARGHDVGRHVEILAGLEQLVREETARQGWALDEEAALALLREDLVMNAQGLGSWLDLQAEAQLA